MATLFTSPFVPAFNASGVLAPGSTLTFYLTGTTTLANIYDDADLTTPLANPITADAGGQFPAIYLDPKIVYRVVLTPPTGSPMERDPYTDQDVVLRLSRFVSFAAAIAAASGGTLLVDRDETITTEMAIPVDTTIQGAGGVLTASSNAFNMLAPGSGCVLEGLILRGPFLGELASLDTVGHGVWLDAVQNAVVADCDIQGFGNSAITVYSDCSNIVIENNLCANQRWNLPGGQGDINTTGRDNRNIFIRRNRCHSNTSSGINLNVTGNDTDIFCENNRCYPLDTATGLPITGTSVMQRHNITAGYVGANPTCRVVVRGNLCANGRWTNIYDQKSIFDLTEMIITDNLCIAGGQNAFVGPNAFPAGLGYPGGQYTASPGIQGGIWSQVTGGETLDDNYLIDCPVGMTVQSPATGIRRVSVNSNTFLRCTTGIELLQQFVGAVISDNIFVASSGSDITWGIAPAITDAGGIIIENNSFFRTVEGYCLRTDSQSAAIPCRFSSNYCYGPGASAGATNIAVSVRFPLWQIDGNRFEDFNYAADVYANMGAIGRYTGPLSFDGNTVVSCNVGFGGSAAAGSLLILEKNKLLSTATLSDAGTAAGTAVARVGEKRSDGSFQVYAAAAATPTAGTWAIGDTVMNSTPTTGQPIGKGCSVAGAPGTWVAWANFA
jgi:hypothetical protein